MLLTAGFSGRFLHALARYRFDRQVGTRGSPFAGRRLSTDLPLRDDLESARAVRISKSENDLLKTAARSWSVAEIARLRPALEEILFRNEALLRRAHRSIDSRPSAAPLRPLSAEDQSHHTSFGLSVLARLSLLEGAFAIEDGHVERALRPLADLGRQATFFELRPESSSQAAGMTFERYQLRLLALAMEAPGFDTELASACRPLLSRVRLREAYRRHLIYDAKVMEARAERALRDVFQEKTADSNAARIGLRVGYVFTRVEADHMEAGGLDWRRRSWQVYDRPYEEMAGALVVDEKSMGPFARLRYRLAPESIDLAPQLRALAAARDLAIEALAARITVPRGRGCDAISARDSWADAPPLRMATAGGGCRLAYSGKESLFRAFPYLEPMTPPLDWLAVAPSR